MVITSIPCLQKMCIGMGVAVIRDHDSWNEDDNVVAAVPLACCDRTTVKQAVCRREDLSEAEHQGW
jgi:hypothetical protein